MYRDTLTHSCLHAQEVVPQNRRQPSMARPPPPLSLSLSLSPLLPPLPRSLPVSLPLSLPPFTRICIQSVYSRDITSLSTHKAAEYFPISLANSQWITLELWSILRIQALKPCLVKCGHKTTIRNSGSGAIFPKIPLPHLHPKLRL